MEEIAEFVTLIDHDEYEILSTYPHTIRRKNDHRVCSETVRNDGYIQIKLNGMSYLKHRLIATQFIDNPDNLPYIDHINHDRTDNRIMNMRWVSSSDNNFNKSSNKGIQYEFVDDIPDEAIKILHYDTHTQHHEFEENKYYYYHDENDEDIFYSRVTNELYRVLHINVNKNNYESVSLMDINHDNVGVQINKFKKQYTLFNDIDMTKFMQNNYPNTNRFLLKDVQQKYAKESGQKLTFAELTEKLGQTGQWKVINVSRTYYVKRQ
mgnify:CR=1 FL=1